MHFEVTFRSGETYQKHLSYGLVFIPTAVWVKGSAQILNWGLTYHSPKYEKGGVKELIKLENLEQYLKTNKEAIILVNEIGHGTLGDLGRLENDLINNGFKVTTYDNDGKLS